MMKKMLLLMLCACFALTMQAQDTQWRENDLAQRQQLLRMGDFSKKFWSTTISWHDGENGYIMEPVNANATKVLLTRIPMSEDKKKEAMTIKVKGEKATCKGKYVTHETLGTWDMLVFRDGKGNILDVLLRVDNSQEAIAEGIERDEEVAEGAYDGVDGRFGFVSVRPLTRGLLKHFAKEDLRLMQWEVYARHGAAIPDPRYWNYFDDQPWYQKTGTDKVRFTDVELFNFSLIQSVEAGR